jgi:hypothetical protein
MESPFNAGACIEMPSLTPAVVIKISLPADKVELFNAVSDMLEIPFVRAWREGRAVGQPGTRYDKLRSALSLSIG